MAHTGYLFTVQEAAFVAEVAVKTVQQTIDRGEIDGSTVRRDDSTHKLDGSAPRRGVGIAEVLYLRVRSALSPQARRDLYAAVRGKRLEDLPARFEVGDVVVDLERAVERVTRQCRRLGYLLQRVQVDPHLYGGEPVFRGTRIPVHLVARDRARGVPPERLLQTFPTLNPVDIDVAEIYASLYPRRGRLRHDWVEALYAGWELCVP